MMARRPRLLIGILVGLVVTSAGCKRKKPPPAPEIPRPTTTVAATATPTAEPKESEPTMPPPGPAGWAYVDAKELVGIDPGGKLTRIKPKRGYISGMRRGSDGKAYVLVRDHPATHVALLEGATLRIVATLKDCYPSLGNVFDVRDDHIAIKCQEGLFVKDGASWEKVDLPADKYEHALHITKEGTLWYVDNDAAYERKGGAWTKATGKTHLSGRAGAFFDGKDGVYFTNGSRVVRVAGGVLEEVRQQKGRWTLELGAASNGLFGYWDRDERLQTFHSVDGPIKKVTAKAWLSEAVLDDTGRAWSVLDGHIEVASPDGSEATRVPMGSYAELDVLGVTSHIVVLGAGPAVPPPKPVRKIKRLVGKITVDGAPLAGADLELCPRSNWMYSGSTPCGGADEDVVQKGTTDAKGGFAFEDVPMGLYFVHYKAPGAEKWTIDSTALPLREGKLSNVGTLAYSKK